MKRAYVLCFAGLGFWLLTAPALGLEARLLADGSAIVLIDGRQHRLREGERSPEGVRLVSSTTRAAIVEYQGEQQTLTLSRRIASRFEESERTQVRIASGAGGHYMTEGRINGHPVAMLVDTGATTVAMNRRTAERLGINYEAGEIVRVSTASGFANAHQVTLERVAVGNLEQRQVAALVTDGDFPEIVLLGNSYLSAVEWRVDQGVLLLEAKY